MFVDPSIHYDPHAERRNAAAALRTRRALVRSRRLHRWAERSARLAILLDRRAGDGRPALNLSAVNRLSSAA
ncbi:hypothetical protein E1212_00285 [Jiangella ureilytica]|uniref:Uncharacterized protein n=1 Tax=Jiangella ureilytica TaxID=2530374 RepID=A0A4R4S3R3_9ACTN|nr:hypothetical protein [Jiangella ureilytica]TDC56936.1 hypothetical protein E1212_00285 [Jiangella ureilytica]